MKLWYIGSAEQVACMGEMRNSYKTLVRKYDGWRTWRSFGRSRQTGEGIIKMYPKVTECDIIDQFKLVPNMYSLMTTSCKHGCDFSGFIITGEFLGLSE
jgi:hypothetical protein